MIDTTIYDIIRLSKNTKAAGKPEKPRYFKPYTCERRTHDASIDTKMLEGLQKGGHKMKYNLSQIMKRAWELFRKGKITFAEALHRSWMSAKAVTINQKRIEDAKAAEGVEEETNTWSSWKQLGYEVIHGSKALFGADLIWGSRGDGAIYKASFFGRSQVREISA